jgi:hypothetical protein
VAGDSAAGPDVPGDAHDEMKMALQIKGASIQARRRARV